MTISRCLEPLSQKAQVVQRQGNFWENAKRSFDVPEVGKRSTRKMQSRQRAVCRNAFFRESFVDIYRRLGRSSDSRISLLAAPSRESSQWSFAAFVPGYSGGTA